MPHGFKLVLVLALVLAACAKGSEKPAAGAAKPAGPTLLLAAEDLHTVRNGALTAGPAITGSVQPERRADLRAEVSAVVLQVLKENGDAVRPNDPLVRPDATAIRDALASAQAGSPAADQAHHPAARPDE